MSKRTYKNKAWERGQLHVYGTMIVYVHWSMQLKFALQGINLFYTFAFPNSSMNVKTLPKVYTCCI